MQHRSLGRSGVEVSRIILGCGNFGGIGSSPAFFGAGETEGEAHALLDAAWEAGITAYDTVYPDIKNVAGLRAEATDARRMGYGGKIAIHPDQVAIIHEVFTPTAQEVDWAKRVIDTFESNPSAGVLTLDGKMLDKPHLTLARRLLGRTGG